MASFDGTQRDNSTASARSPREVMELFFFNLFQDNFMQSIGPVRSMLKEKHPGLLEEITANLHKLSAHAADMIQRQGLTFQDLAQSEQDLFTGEFLRQIGAFAEKVRESFENITPDQEQKLVDHYTRKSGL